MSPFAVQRTAPLVQCRSSSYMSCCDFGVPGNCGQISLPSQDTRGLLALLRVQHDSYLQQHDCVRWCHHLCLVRCCRRVASGVSCSDFSILVSTADTVQMSALWSRIGYALVAGFRVFHAFGVSLACHLDIISCPVDFCSLRTGHWNGACIQWHVEETTLDRASTSVTDSVRKGNSYREVGHSEEN